MPGIKQFFRDATTGGQRRRSRTGILASILMLPALLGVLACFSLPVPIGNPEKSRIDPAMTGVWATRVEEKTEDAWILVLEPYDKRTWLVSWIMLKTAESYELKPADMVNGYVDLSRLLRRGDLKVDKISFNKGWLTSINGYQFMIWEPKVVMKSDEPMKPKLWWTMRVRKVVGDSMVLDYVNPGFDEFETALGKFGDKISSDQVGKIFERVIRKNVTNSDLYLAADEEFPNEYVKISTDDYKFVHRLLKQVSIFASDD